MSKEKNNKFKYGVIIWLLIFTIGLVTKVLQNDTFYTIKIGKLIIEHGIDMMDHFSIHTGLAYTYPHWLYDVFIYLIYNLFGYTGLYISSITFMFIILLLVFKTNYKITNNNFISTFATFICALALSGFITARAQTVTFILFVLEIYFIESFLKNGKQRNLIGLLLISLIICNIHVAVWAFYYILFLPYLAEYVIAWIVGKIKLKKEYKLVSFLKKKLVIEKNKNIKYLFIIMIASLLTGLLTPIGDTPYTYLIKTMMGNSQKYIQEHQMISWINSPFTIIIAGETIFLALFARIKLRDLFMICGLSLMSVLSVRHISLLALIGTICFARTFNLFFEYYNFSLGDKVISFICKKKRYIYCYILVIIFSSFMLYIHLQKDFIDKEMYPVAAVKYIKENIDIDNMRIYNDYNFGSYLLLNDIPIFIDSRADLYTKQFSGFDYDIFDDYEFMVGNYQERFEFYKITHALIYKKDNAMYVMLSNDKDYKLLYDDDNFAFFEKVGIPNVIVTYDKKNLVTKKNN